MRPRSSRKRLFLHLLKLLLELVGGKIDGCVDGLLLVLDTKSAMADSVEGNRYPLTGLTMLAVLLIVYGEVDVDLRNLGLVGRANLLHLIVCVIPHRVGDLRHI